MYLLKLRDRVDVKEHIPPMIHRPVLPALGVAVLVASVLWGTPRAAAQQSVPAVQVGLASGSPEEVQARDQLLAIVEKWDLSKWLFTREARIEARAIPHSHPVLTLNARYLANDTAQIATFVHEQLHWFFVRREAATDAAVAELERLFPDAPDGPEGAGDPYSTYLHLLVCLLEYDALVEIFDEGVARRTSEGWRHYPWIYRQVLDRPAVIRGVLVLHGLDDPDARPGAPTH